MQIRAETLAEAHMEICKEIYAFGDEVITEDGDITFEYPEPVLLIITNPISESMVSVLCKFGQKAMAKYSEQLLYGCDSGFVYTYHERLFEYLCECGVKVDQIHNLIEKLKIDPTSRRAQAITWYPNTDMDSGNPPCLQRIQFLIRGGKLNMDVNFRSNDCLSALGQNMFVFAHLLEYVAESLCLPIGVYTHYITSAHIYLIRDASEMGPIRLAICGYS